MERMSDLGMYWVFATSVAALVENEVGVEEQFVGQALVCHPFRASSVPIDRARDASLELRQYERMCDVLFHADSIE